MQEMSVFISGTVSCCTVIYILSLRSIYLTHLTSHNITQQLLTLSLCLEIKTLGDLEHTKCINSPRAVKIYMLHTYMLFKHIIFSVTCDIFCHKKYILNPCVLLTFALLLHCLCVMCVLNIYIYKIDGKKVLLEIS